YGQTGTGKTFTITGPEPQSLEEIEAHKSFGLESDGVIPQAASRVCELIDSHPEIEFQLNVGYIEIYNEQIYDLLVDKRVPLQLRGGGVAGSGQGISEGDSFFVVGQQYVRCFSREDIISLLEKGAKNKHMASHNLNQESSRSHTLLTFRFIARGREEVISNTSEGGNEEDLFQQKITSPQSEIVQTQRRGLFARNKSQNFDEKNETETNNNQQQFNTKKSQQMNSKSPRNQRNVKQESDDQFLFVRRSKITFVDLAGSERLKQSGS
ncbi:MAG: hypothetical protein EZS28_053268, partial [Streblomastix strix]